MGNNSADMQSDLYKAIDDLVRNHDRREPYITNTVQRIYWLVRDGLPVDRISNQSDYKKGYNSGYVAGKRAQLTEATQERKDISDGKH